MKLLPLLAGVLACARPLVAQVTATATLHDGVATVLVGNSTKTALTVSVSLWRDATRPGGPVTLGDSLPARISPQSFVLPAGQIQTVRLKVHAAVTPHELLRLVTLLDPPPPTKGAVQLAVRMRIISRVVVS
jgi:P pilus assembly chaperone PapD